MLQLSLYRTITTIALISLLTGATDLAYAKSRVRVVNNVNVSTRTGGNVATQGDITSGKDTVNVDVRSVVNGKELAPVRINTQPGDLNKKVVIKKEASLEGEGGSSKVRTEVRVEQGNDKTAITSSKGFGDTLMSWLKGMARTISRILIGG